MKAVCEGHSVRRTRSWPARAARCRRKAGGRGGPGGAPLRGQGDGRRRLSTLIFLLYTHYTFWGGLTRRASAFGVGREATGGYRACCGGLQWVHIAAAAEIQIIDRGSACKACVWLPVRIPSVPKSAPTGACPLAMATVWGLGPGQGPAMGSPGVLSG